MYENIKNLANALMDALMFCDDGDFVDEVIASIAAADYFEVEEGW